MVRNSSYLEESVHLDQLVDADLKKIFQVSRLAFPSEIDENNTDNTTIEEEKMATNMLTIDDDEHGEHTLFCTIFMKSRNCLFVSANTSEYVTVVRCHSGDDAKLFKTEEGDGARFHCLGREDTGDDYCMGIGLAFNSDKKIGEEKDICPLLFTLTRAGTLNVSYFHDKRQSDPPLHTPRIEAVQASPWSPSPSARAQRQHCGHLRRAS